MTRDTVTGLGDLLWCYSEVLLFHTNEIDEMNYTVAIENEPAFEDKIKANINFYSFFDD